MKSKLLRAASAILGGVAAVGDRLIGLTHALADACAKASLEEAHAVECPYCQEHIRHIDDHTMWCDIPESLKTPLAADDTPWPVMRYGVPIHREWAVALTKKRSE